MLRIAIAAGLLLALNACATPVPLPPAGNLPPPKNIVATTPLARGLGAAESKTFEAVADTVYESGRRNEFGVTIDARLAAAYAAFAKGEPELALAALEGGASEQAEARWLAAALRFEALLRVGRAADAEILADDIGAQELALTQTNVGARAMRGVARMTLGRFDEALADLGQVAATIGGWSMPISYMGPPTNVFALMLFTSAQLRAYTGIAVVHARRGDYTQARDRALAAEALYRDFYYVRTHALYGSGSVPPEAAYGRAFNLATLGLAQGQLAPNNAQAVAPLQAARRFFDTRRHVFGSAVAQAYLAQAALVGGRLHEAINFAEEGERFAATAGLPDMVWQFALGRGEAELRLGRVDRAEAAFRAAQSGIESVSGALSSDEARVRFGTGKEAVTRHLVAIDRARNDNAALFGDMERGRARAFVDLLQGVPMAQGRQADAVARIRKLDDQLRRLRLKNLAGAGQPLSPLLDERRNAIAALRQRDPELADALGVAAAELAPVQGRLSDGEVLAYAVPVAPGQPLAWLLVARDGTRIVTSDLHDGELQALLAEFAAARDDEDAKRQSELAARMSIRLRLGDWKATKALYVVPGGASYFLPWGALDVEVPVAVLPLGGWLLRETAAAAAPRSAAVAGDPDFSGKYPPLPGARREAGDVASTYRTQALLGAAATESAVRRAVASGVDVLHLATHGYFRADAPLGSGVVLAGGDAPQLLTAAHLVAAPLPARLVVLSACETGVGKAVAGDDFLGLPRSFYLGGTRAVLASLWPVDDEPTQLFMKIFHERLAADGLGGAWLAARNALKRQDMPPSAYGAFVLGGAVR